LHISEYVVHETGESRGSLGTDDADASDEGAVHGTHRGGFKQGAEGFLVNTGCNQLEELVVPGLLIGVLLLGSPGQDIAWSCEEVRYDFYSRLTNK